MYYYSPQRSTRNLTGNYVRAFSTWRISHHTSQGSVKSYFIATAHNKSDAMYGNSERQNAWLRMKIITILYKAASRKHFYLTVEVAVAHSRSKPYVYGFVYTPVLNLNDDTVRRNSEVPYHCQQFRLLPAILDIQQTIVSPAVGRGGVHVAIFVASFHFWNDVSIFCDSEVSSTSGSAAMFT